ncbi:hypothetical protein [Nonomuraea sp. NPDC049758]|uniref:class III lanthionine synthetase LanKC N-terminal domain-containing protein n=1 Tax=Nonomuraea sp. NPDC049758 TaxID=3154360 RepID=UPI00341C485C
MPVQVRGHVRRPDRPAVQERPPGIGRQVHHVYPPDDEAATAIAEDLHRATYGLPGPPVLSDRAYRPGSLVHYRYGVFSARSVLDNDGVYSSPLTDPDGACLVDRRNAWYSPPEWAACPFESGRAPVRTAAPEAVELDGRFVVRQAIRHGAKGGVFLAEDRLSGAQVVIKQARPHISATLQGQDERDRLRHEADMLDLFGPLGVTSRKVALFTQGDNVFLAQEHLDGAVLTAWAEQARAADPDGWPHVALTAVRALTGLVAAVHERGFVLRDLTPNNVIAGPDGSCRLVDLEMAAVPGTPVTKAFTAGYAPPEQVRGPMYGPAAGPEADLYALGATVLHLATACRPLLGSDDPSAGRSWDTRVRGLVEVATEGDAVASALRPMLLGLMRENPARRWDLRRIGTFLDDLEPLPASAPNPQPRPATATGGARRLSVAGQERLLRDGVAHTLRRMDRDPGARRLWPVSGFGETADPCAVQYGSAGVLALLASVLNTSDLDTSDLDTADLDTPVLGTGEVGRGDVVAALRHAAAWTLRRLGSEARPSPGLHFGRAGIAWGLYEAGRALGDDALRTAGTDLALTLPTSWQRREHRGPDGRRRRPAEPRRKRGDAPAAPRRPGPGRHGLVGARPGRRHGWRAQAGGGPGRGNRRAGLPHDSGGRHGRVAAVRPGRAARARGRCAGAAGRGRLARHVRQPAGPACPRTW